MSCPECGAPEQRLTGHVARDYVQAWQCQDCSHVWPRYTDEVRGPLSQHIADRVRAGITRKESDREIR